MPTFTRLAALAVLFAALVATPARAGQIGSAYTKIDLDACRLVAEYELGARFLCPGFQGIPVHFAEGDLRILVSYGEGGADEQAMRVTPPWFNSVKGPIEWRFETKGGRRVPFATILRFYLDHDGQPGKGQVLIVTRLGEGETCHVGYVDARARRDANTVARDVADRTARTFDCAADTPLFLGAPDADSTNFWETAIR